MIFYTGRSGKVSLIKGFLNRGLKEGISTADALGKKECQWEEGKERRSGSVRV
jgi:hypothetical protein